jgi:uncharacterized spore protein YtfJ
MENVNDVIGQIANFLKSEATTESIIGQQFQLGEFTCVPVMSLGLGIGGGAGGGKAATGAQANEGAGSGGGAGLGLGPVGFLVTRGADIQFISTSSSRGFGSIFEKMPDLFSKFLEKKENGKNT